MSVQVENLEKNMAKLTIEVSAEELEKALQAAYNKQKKSISLPGFRKGKVPRVMVEKMYGANVFCDDAANAILPVAYPAAVEECKLDIVSRPALDIVQLEKGKPFIFTAEVAVKPEVTLGKYVGVTVTKIDTTATEEDIQKEIDAEREKNSRTVAVEDRAIESGDIAVIDYAGSIDGVAFEGGTAENHPLEIGSNSFIPGFEDQLIGKNIGDEVDVNITFPEEYHAEDLAGKPAVFKVKIHEIKRKEVPELDEEFVQDVSEFDTVEEYKNSIKEKVEERKAKEAKAEQTDEAIKKIVDKSEMEIPEAMIETRCEDMIDQFGRQMQQQGLSLQQYLQFTGSSVDQLKEQVREDALAQIKSDLVLEQIVKEEQIEATDEDVNEELQKMADLYKMELDKLTAYMGDAEKDNIKKDLAIQKAITYVMDSVKYRAKAKTKKEKEAEAAATEQTEATEE